jgi:hypothetical protein
MAEFFVSMATLADYFAGEPWGLPAGAARSRRRGGTQGRMEAGTTVPS